MTYVPNSVILDQIEVETMHDGTIIILFCPYCGQYILPEEQPVHFCTPLQLDLIQKELKKITSLLEDVRAGRTAIRTR